MSRFLVLLAVLAWSFLPAGARGQSQAFTFQGQLRQDDVPITDEVDLVFFLYNTDSDENPVAGPITFDGQQNPPVDVFNGLFTVELDFGVGELQQGQWLGIHVRSPHDPTDSGAYTQLRPRQHLTAAPFALSVPGLASDTEGVEVAGDMHATGEVIASAFSSNSPLIFKVNPSNTECARFDDANCYFGLGTDGPQARLHIGGAAGVDGIMFPDGSIQTTAAGLGGGDGFWSANGGHIYKNNGGSVGIGTSLPTSLLDVRGNLTLEAGASPVLYTGVGNVERNRYLLLINTPEFPSASGVKAGGVLVSDSYDFANPGKNDLIVKGAVGIGTAAPIARLSVEAFGYGLLHTDGAVQVGTYANASGGWLGTRSNHPLHFFTNDSGVLMSLNTAGHLGVGISSPVRRLHVRNTDLFSARFESSNSVASVVEFRNSASNSNWEFGVAGSASTPWNLSAGSYYLYHQGDDRPAMTVTPGLFRTEINSADFMLGHASRRGAPGRALVDFGDHLVVNFGSDWGYTFVHGRLRCNVLEVAGADLAEKFPSNETEVEPGTVMEIDPENPGKLRIAREAYSHRVAGVVSGAGDLKAGTVLGNEGAGQDGPAIALSGRVWVRCNASSGAIQVGDLLTTSTTPGLAMRASERERSHGAILGKAMTELPPGESGLVLVLVTLQ